MNKKKESWEDRDKCPDGYIRLECRDRRGALIRDHVVNAQIKYGRSLMAGEVVHHINEIRDDNRPENLEILTRSAHTRIHHIGKIHKKLKGKKRMAKLKEISRGVGKRILKLRIASELTRTEFGDQIGVSYRYIDMLENGERQPSQALLIAMAVRLDFNENYLRTGRNGREK